MRGLFALVLLAGKLAAAELVVNGSFEQGALAWEALWQREPGKVTATSQGATGRGQVLKVVSTSDKDWSFGQSSRLSVAPGDLYELSGQLKAEGVKGEATLSLVTYDAQGKVLAWEAGQVASRGSHGWQRLGGRWVVPEGCAQVQFRIVGAGAGTSTWDDVALQRLGQARDLGNEKRRALQALGLDPAFEFSALGAHAAGELSFAADKGDIVLTLAGTGAMGADVEFPGPLQTSPEDEWILPFNEGLKVPAQDLGFKYAWDLELSSGHFISMPFYALSRQGKTLLVVSEEASDSVLRLNNGQLTFAFKPSLGQWAYPRKVRLIQVQGGYVEAAAAYRRYAESRGLVSTLAEKARRNPNITKLYGAVNLWRWGNRFWWDGDPEAEKFAAELKALGVEHVLWSHEVASAAAAKKISELGYLVGRYKNFQDLSSPTYPQKWSEKRGWPEELVLDPAGEWVRGWVVKEEGKEYPAGVRCAVPGLAFARKEFKDEQARIPYSAAFLDTTTATGMRECYHPKHPTDERADMQAKRKQLQVASDELGLVTGSETGADWAVRDLAYFEGMLSLGEFRLPDAGYDLFSHKAPTPEFLKFQISPKYRIPLFELVYHDCVVSYNYWGDANNRLPEYWDDRDLLCILYGQPPFWHVDKQLWAEQKERFLKSYRDVVPVALELAGKRMVGHRSLSKDKMVQETTWEGGKRVLVNFGVKAVKVEGTTLKPKGFVVQ